MGWLGAVAPDDTDDADDPCGPLIRLDERGLTCTVGPFPQYALYYYRAPDDSFFACSSSLELLVETFSSGRLNVERLANLLVWGTPFSDPAATPFREVRRVLPGEWIEVGPGGLRIERRIPRVGSSYIRASTQDLAQALREHLDQAVERAIGRARHVAVMAGGGLDSSGVLAVAVARCRGASRRELAALALDYAAPGDDRPYLAELSRALGLVPLRLKPSGAGPYFVRSLCLDAQPSMLATVPLSIQVQEAARNVGADVALSGVSGDTMLGGLPYAFALLAARGHPLRALAGALRVRLPWPTRPVRRVRDLVLSPVLGARQPSWLRRMRAMRRQQPPWLTRRFTKLIESSSVPRRDTLPDTPDEWMAFHCNSHILADAADLANQISAISPCLVADVFADPRMVKFLLQVDPVVLSHGPSYRGLYREAMRGILPERVRLRNDKAGFEPAIAEAGRACPELGRLAELRDLRGLSSLGLTDGSAFGPTFDAYLSRFREGAPVAGDELWQRVWQLLAVEQFVREHPPAP
jgi:asparagine synthase (glutamine-hydrolysing)